MLTSALARAAWVVIAAAASVGCGGGLSADCKCETCSFHVESVLPSLVCAPQSGSDAPALAVGVLDTALANTYGATLNVGLDDAFDHTASVYLRRAEIEVGVDGAPRADLSFVREVGGTLRGAEEATAWTAVYVPLIEDASAFAGSSEIAVNLRVLGADDSGGDHASPWFEFAIQMCEACLIDYPPEQNASPLGYACFMPLYDEAPPCRLGQDHRVNCAHCSQVNPVCVAPPT